MQDQTIIKNIVLADDDHDDCLFFKEAVEELELPVRLTIANNGEQLMDYLLQPGTNLPDILFLDLNMPRKNGFACLAEIKSNKSLSAIPVVVFSTCYDEAVAQSLYQNGAHYYICKPAGFAQLKKTIRHVHHILTENREQPLLKKFFINKL